MMSRQADTYMAARANKHHRSTPPGCKICSEAGLLAHDRATRDASAITLAFPRQLQWLARLNSAHPRVSHLQLRGQPRLFRVPS